MFLKAIFNINRMYVCLCKGVSDKDIKHLVSAGACSVEEIMRCTGAGTGCGSCVGEIDELVGEGPGRSSPLRRRLAVVNAEQTAA